MSAPTTDQIITHLLSKLSPLELLRVVPMPEAERLSGVSADTLERAHPDKIVRPSKHRRGMRVAHALMLQEVDDTD
jgi:hypothetical protein